MPADELEKLFSSGRETVVSILIQDKTTRCGGVKYSIAESTGVEWTTHIVCNIVSGSLVVSVRVTCEDARAPDRLPPARKPYFVKQILSELGGGMDGDVPVADQAIFLAEGQELAAAALILGKARNRLPIVYVSSSYNGGYAVDPLALSRWVSGTAHVVVEPSRAFSFRLRSATASRNAYGGAIGVYWPESGRQKSYFLGRQITNPRALSMEIARDIRSSLSNRRQIANCSWAFLKEQVSSRRLEKLREQGSAELEEFYSAFGAEIASKELRIEQLEAENAAAHADYFRYRAPQSGTVEGVLAAGLEQDLFEGEILGVVRDALAHYASAVLPGSRREHIVRDLLEANPGSSAAHEKAEEIKAVLRGYKVLDAKSRVKLERLGFEISDDGKHYKAVYMGDGRYTFAISKSSSDVRAGLNLVSDICKQIL
ncbi:hypothetical protein [Arenimonas soli]|nr:hypothetical protein [Arenimonas soli]